MIGKLRRKFIHHSGIPKVDDRAADIADREHERGQGSCGKVAVMILCQGYVLRTAGRLSENRARWNQEGQTGGPQQCQQCAARGPLPHGGRGTGSFQASPIRGSHGVDHRFFDPGSAASLEIATGPRPI
jgi:hypothetical protein